VSSFQRAKIDFGSCVIEARMTPGKFWFFTYNTQIVCLAGQRPFKRSYAVRVCGKASGNPETGH
jgi:hypothetical protein